MPGGHPGRSRGCCLKARKPLGPLPAAGAFARLAHAPCGGVAGKAQRAIAIWRKEPCGPSPFGGIATWRIEPFWPCNPSGRSSCRQRAHARSPLLPHCRSLTVPFGPHSQACFLQCLHSSPRAHNPARQAQSSFLLRQEVPRAQPHALIEHPQATWLPARPVCPRKSPSAMLHAIS